MVFIETTYIYIIYLRCMQFRNNRDNEGKYIAQCLEEIKQELRQVTIFYFDTLLEV